jgi:hypothetical protein
MSFSISATSLGCPYAQSCVGKGASLCSEGTIICDYIIDEYAFISSVDLDKLVNSFYHFCFII